MTPKLDLRPPPRTLRPPPLLILYSLYIAGKNDTSIKNSGPETPSRTPSLTPSEILDVGFLYVLFPFPIEFSESHWNFTRMLLDGRVPFGRSQIAKARCCDQRPLDGGVFIREPRSKSQVNAGQSVQRGSIKMRSRLQRQNARIWKVYVR